MKKKILFMLTSMNIGGVEKSLLSLLSTISRDKYEVTVLLLEKKGGFLRDIPEWVKVEEAGWFKQLKPIILQPPQVTIKNYLLNKEYSKTISFVCIYLVSKYLNNRYLYYQHVLKRIPNNPIKYDKAIAYQGPTDIIDFYIANKVNAQEKISWVHFDVSKHYINEKFYKKIYKKFNNIYVVSSLAKKKLVEKVKGITHKTNVQLNIIPEKEIWKMAKMSTSFDEGYKGFKIVTVGRLSKEKGQDFAIKVLNRLRCEGFDVRWYCIGDGQQRSDYELLRSNLGLESDFIFFGAKENPYPYILQSDIYVQPSRHEGYCITLAEAKCLCKPIVTTNFVGAVEQIQSGIDGFIVGCSEEELYIKLKYLLLNKSERDKLAENLKKQSRSSVEFSLW